MVSSSTPSNRRGKGGLDWASLKDHPAVLVTLDEEVQDTHLLRMAQGLDSTCVKTTVLCFNHTAAMLIEDFREEGLETGNFVFIDTLTAETVAVPAGCVVLHTDGPLNLDALLGLVSKACSCQGCRVVLIDSLSSLLSFHDRHEVLLFLNGLKGELLRYALARMVVFAIRRDSFPAEEGRQLLTDLEMFVDKSYALAKD